MKKILLVLFFLASLCAAQSVPTTPNVGMYLPPHGQQNWDFYLNSNFTLLDNIFGGTTHVPNFVATSGTFTNLITTNFTFGTGANFADDGHGGVVVLSNNGDSGIDLDEAGSYAEIFYGDSSAGGDLTITSIAGQCTSLYSAPHGGWQLFSFLAPGTLTPNMCGDTTGVYSVPIDIVVGNFSALTACSSSIEGMRGSVKDSTTSTNGATITGGGSNHVAAYCNGTNWVVASGTGSGGSSGLNGTVTYTTAHTLSTSDNGKLVQMNCSSACAVTFPNPQPSSTFYAQVQSIGSTVATVTLGSSITWNGGSSAPSMNSYRPLDVFADSATSTNYAGKAPLVAGTNITFTPSANGLTISSTAGGGTGTGFVGINSQTTSYTAVSGDTGKLVVMNCTAACTFTVYGSPTSGYKVSVVSVGSTLATVSLNSKNFNGASNVPILNSFEPVEFSSDGTNYFGKPPTAIATNGGLTVTGSSNAMSLASTFSTPTTGGTRYFQLTTGSTATTVNTAANTTYMYAFVAPWSMTTGHVTYGITTADNTADDYDIGIYDVNGNLVCHLGATAGTTFAPSTGFRTLAWLATGNLIAGNRYYLAFTANATTAIFDGISSSNNVSMAQSHSNPSSGSTTSGGALNSSVTPATDNWPTAATPPNVTIY